MAAGLDATDLSRLRRTGVAGFSAREGLAMFDAALRSPVPDVVTARFDAGALRARASAGELPAMLRELVPDPVDRAPGARAKPFAERLAGMAEAEQLVLAETVVRDCVAHVLTHDSAEIGREQAFRDLGLDSLTGIELRNRLTAVTGLRLPSEVVFDHPTVAGVAERLVRESAVAD
jgi:acyl carrier protein